MLFNLFLCSLYLYLISFNPSCSIIIIAATVEDIVTRGGSCLIPVFSLGRAQELLLILDEYWQVIILYYSCIHHLSYIMIAQCVMLCTYVCDRGDHEILFLWLLLYSITHQYAGSDTLLFSIFLLLLLILISNLLIIKIVASMITHLSLIYLSSPIAYVPLFFNPTFLSSISFYSLASHFLIVLYVLSFFQSILTSFPLFNRPTRNYRRYRYSMRPS